MSLGRSATGRLADWLAGSAFGPGAKAKVRPKADSASACVSGQTRYGRLMEAHETAISRITQAGAKSITWVSLICELQRAWNRQATVPGFVETLFAVEGA